MYCSPTLRLLNALFVCLNRKRTNYYLPSKLTTDVNLLQKLAQVMGKFGKLCVARKIVEREKIIIMHTTERYIAHMLVQLSATHCVPERSQLRMCNGTVKLFSIGHTTVLDI